MARREVRDCDRCDAKEPENIRTVLSDHPRVSGQMDALTSEFDLCPACMAQIMTKHLYGKTEEQAWAFIGGNKYETYLAAGVAEAERVERQDQARQ